jgi:hypothetical protein
MQRLNTFMKYSVQNTLNTTPRNFCKEDIKQYYAKNNMEDRHSICYLSTKEKEW